MGLKSTARASIDVVEEGAGAYVVTVRERGAETVHHVTVGDDDVRRLTGGRASGTDLVLRSFEFLLEREPKEAILRRFELTVIGRYFAEWEQDIRRRLGA